jgi:molecular chaperone DnaK
VGIPSAPRGVPQIEVTFAIDSNGIVNVSARDMATNRSQSIQINPAGGLSKDEIDTLVLEAEQQSLGDREKRELAEIRNRVEGLIYNNERVYEEFRTTLGEDDRKTIHEALLKARTVLASEDRAELEAVIYDLHGVSQRLSDVMLRRSGT